MGERCCSCHQQEVWDSHHGYGEMLPKGKGYQWRLVSEFQSCVYGLVKWFSFSKRTIVGIKHTNKPQTPIKKIKEQNNPTNSQNLSCKAIAVYYIGLYNM